MLICFFPFFPFHLFFWLRLLPKEEDSKDAKGMELKSYSAEDQADTRYRIWL